MMSPELDWVFYTAIAVLTISNWFGAAGKKRGLYYTTKPLVIVALLLFFSQKGGLDPQRWPFFLALVFSLLGDVFLIPRAMRWFIAGIWAFLLAQVAYLFGFNRYPLPVHILGIGLMVWLLLSFGWVRYVLARTQKYPELMVARRSFIPYGILLIGMTVSAVLCLWRPAWPTLPAALAAGGGVFFLVSDILLAADRIGKRFPLARFWVISTYHIAQFLLVAAALNLPHF
jgi:uncharacterized membrane protein YhhN